LIQRLLTGTALFFSAIAVLGKESPRMSTAPQIIAAAAGIFLALGLWTPVMGTLVAMAELWIAFARLDSPWTPILLATFGATLAMIGPGAWSVDAKLFGRKHIETPHN
jgi:uncharacterized membrane protein YphA (DoxX/SURF4 family)